jgi:hypothetical protein
MAKTTYLFGSGAVAKGAATLDGEPLPGGFKTAGVELARVPLDRGSVPINRRRFILHPRGVKFASASVAGDSPTNPELDPRANWTRVYEYKNVRIVTVTNNDDDAWPLGCCQAGERREPDGGGGERGADYGQQRKCERVGVVVSQGASCSCEVPARRARGFTGS